MNYAVEETPQSYTKAKFAIFLTLFTAGVGNSFVFAVLQPLGRQIGLQEIQIGSIITISATVFMFSAPIWGHKSEKWGRKPIITFALCAYCVLTLCFGTTIKIGLAGLLPIPVIWVMLIFFRATFSAGIGGMFPCSQAYMADITTPAERTAGMALVGMSSGLGMISGPIMAAVASRISPIFPFYVVAGLALVAVMVARAFIVEAPVHPRPERHDDTPLMKWQLVPFLMTSTIMMMSLASMQMANGFYLQDKFSLSELATTQHTGGVMMASAMASISAQFILVHRFRLTPKMLMRFGFPFVLTGVTLFSMAPTYPLMLGAMGCFGLGMGMIMPGNVSALSMSVGNHQQGKMAGLGTAANGLGFIIGPMLGSGLYKVFPQLPYRVAIGLLLAATLLVWFVAKFPEDQKSGLHS
jgi:MFS family permease